LQIQTSLIQASFQALAQATGATPSVRKRGREIPDPRVSGGEANQGAAWRSPSRDKPTSTLYSEIPTCDCLSRVRHVAVHQLRLAFHLSAAEGRYRLKNDQKTTRRLCEMLSLDVALGEYDFERVLVEANQTGVVSALLSFR
jgi:hypothetical protein